ncbi:predicted metal-dependent hydrolase [Hahella chejuensis KCTC 2396]|uniref:Predicted metal-dependent hydrolase n=1 Tax=Hahella chejuensis (strain KCTC 2396) TaxID=349521 RepID=Q2SLR2_HAHCH|nr:cyclase family protein [Hahella chejuensis]ABC28412.1 predicted metal-dependent hydrolase [Hahella chejuensis KCTC 2396]
MPLRTLQFSNIIDLSHPIDANIPLWPGDPTVHFTDEASIAKDGYFLRSFQIGEHSGTHMNAPASFFTDGMTIDSYKPEQLMPEAVVIDVSAQAQEQPDYTVTIQDIHHWEQNHGVIPAGCIVLFYTGYQHFWKTPERFFNMDAQGVMHFPGLAAETAKYLLEERKVSGLGIDTHGVDPGFSVEHQVNCMTLAQSGIVLECLTNLDRLPPKGVTLAIGLLRLRGGSGSPVSVLAFIP